MSQVFSSLSRVSVVFWIPPH